MRTRKSLASIHACLFLTALCLMLACGCPQQNPVTKTSAPGETGSYDKAPEAFDPIAANGPILEGWTKPELTLVITGQLWGYLEPCGCAGLHNQKGGLSRRQAFLNDLRDERGWPVVAVDAGGLSQRFGAQAEIKFQTALSALRQLGYVALGVGPGDLRLPAEALLAAAGEDQDAMPFVSANVGVLGFDSGVTKPYRIVEQGGKKLGITSVLGKQLAEETKSADIEVIDPSAALEKILPQLKAENPDILVLLVQSNPDEAEALAKQFPDFDIVAAAEGAEEPPASPREIEGTKSWLVEFGHKGMYAAVIGWFADPAQPRRYQRVPLDSRFPGTPAMAKLLEDYQAQLESLVMTSGFDALGARKSLHPRAATENDPLGLFVGSERCGKCHTKALAVWKKSNHAKATETLTKTKPPRMSDPECLSCHVTGWNAQEYYPYAGGFESLEKTPHLAGNGCENCHGPGGAHAEAEEDRMNRDIARREQLRQSLRLTKSTIEDSCKRCHDLDNSPEFNFTKYWPKVEHKGKD